MEFLHCNRCFQRNPPAGYLISSCFHIFCSNCAKSDPRNCSMCKKEVKIVQLNGKISQGIRIYFTDPISSLTEFLEKLQRKVEFQSNIRIHLIKHLTKEKEKKRQMEVYFRKKGHEFEAQKKQLVEKNNWIKSAERKLQASEEERIRLQREFDELQMKLQSMCSLPAAQPLPVTPSPSTPFSFIMAESEELLERRSSSPNSTFNMVSPLIHSPAMSLNDTTFHNFFDKSAIDGEGANGLGDDTMFATVSTNSHQRSTMSDTTAFSATFNNMYTPASKDVEMTMMDKTSVSLDNWRTHRNESIAAIDMSSRRETSLPPTATPLPAASSSSSAHHHHRQHHHHHQNLPRHHHSLRNPSSSSSSSQQQQQQTALGAMRDIRRHSSQPGYLAHRKSINNRSGSSGTGSGGASFADQEGLF